MDAARDFLEGIKISSGAEICPAESFARFPFMATADYLYGPLENSEKEDLWAFGQQSLSLMGNVLAGGVCRLEAARWLRPQVNRRLKEFERNWSNFNVRIVNRKQASGQTSLPIVQAWKAVDKGEVSNKEVRTITPFLLT